MYDVVVKFTFDISSPDEFHVHFGSTNVGIRPVFYQPLFLSVN